ncbi:ATP-binding cassette domain-containing protein [Peribacillus frigoritolerans]|nr:ATP-binding cassette domain-containing protein [Peribacillus frigoritolerans]
MTKIYSGFVVLKDLSLDLNQEEIVGLIGKNGAGKSTLMKIIT